MRRLPALALLAFGLVFAATLALPAAETGEQALETLAKSYWDSLLARDWSRVYDLSSPQLRAEVEKEEFAATNAEKNPLQFLSYSLGPIEIAGDFAWVEVSCTARAYKFSNAAPRSVKLMEVWKKDAGTWHHLQREEADKEAPVRPPSQRNAVEETALGERAERFWTAREQERWDIVYQLCDPKLRELMSAEDFLNRKSLRSYLSHAIEWVEVSGDAGKTKTSFRYRSRDPALAKLDPGQDSLMEKWIRLDGVWYREIPGIDQGGNQ